MEADGLAAAPRHVAAERIIASCSRLLSAPQSSPQIAPWLALVCFDILFPELAPSGSPCQPGDQLDALDQLPSGLIKRV